MKKIIQHLLIALLLGLAIFVSILVGIAFQKEQIDWNWFGKVLAIKFIYTFPMYFTVSYSFSLAKKLRHKFAVKKELYWLAFIPIVAVLNVIVLVFVQFFVERIILKNVNYQLIGGNFIQQLKYPLLFSLTIGTGFYLVFSIQAYRREKAKAKDQALKKSQRSNEALQSQIGSHFLFNSLNVLSGLVEENSKKAQDFIADLAEVYRYVLDQSEKDWVSVKDEIKFAEDYLNLVKMRFENGLEIHIQEELKYSEKLIAPLSLQLLLENAIKHNAISNQKTLKINIEEKDGFLIVENNINPKKLLKKREGKGLQNIIDRYEAINKKVIVFDDSKTFKVEIPLLNLTVIKDIFSSEKIDLNGEQSLVEKEKQENKMENNQKQVKTIADSVFVGCMFIGGGIGFLCNAIPMGGAIGMGIGFFAKAMIMAYYNK
ncbi:histidine kinase [Weeksellaceae bacterium TAE3-ERU29]|nr:histidine kinase [Weeksellaceae bacterium TAE3-ERU29]